MNKLILLTVFSFLILNISYGQDRKEYLAIIEEARDFYKKKDFLTSGRKYSKAFTLIDDDIDVKNRYNAACVWALANQADSAFVQLFKVVEKGRYKNFKHITADIDFTLLHTDKRWNRVIEIVKKNKDEAEANLDKFLIAVLDTVRLMDQKYRKQTKIIGKKYGWKSDKIKTHFKIINDQDSINLIKIEKIIRERGWLGSDIIGIKGNSTLFLVIQHSKPETQEKYMPIMKEAVENKNARATDLALLEDRIALRKYKKQIYGSQVALNQETGEYYVLPLIDPDNVNKRRKEVGLRNIEDYLSYWGIIWDVNEYKMKITE